MGMHRMHESSNGKATRLAKRKKRERKANPRTLRRVAQTFGPYKAQIVLVLLAIICITGLGLVNPLMISLVFDEAIAKRNLHLLIIFVSIMFITPIVSGLISVGQTYLNNLIGQNVMRDIRNKLYQHMQSMSLRFFTSTRTGEIQSRLTNDVNGVENIVTGTVTSIVSNFAIALSSIIAMLLLSPLLTFISLGLLPIFLWITAKIGNARRSTSKEAQESIAALTIHTQETLSVSGILLIKTFGRQRYVQQRFEAANQKLTNLEMRQLLIGRWFFMLINVFFLVTPAIVYLVAGLQINANPLNPPISLGKIVAFTTLQSRLFSPIGQLLAIQIETQGALALFDRIFEYLDLPVEIKDRPRARHLKAEEVRGAISFKDVSFTYQRDPLVSSLFKPETPDIQNGKGSHQRSAKKANGKADGPVSLALVAPEELTARNALSHISFEIKPGQLAALVGPSGAGKTTITYLVPRLYDVGSGAVEIDGHNVKDITLEALGSIIGMVTQETYLFHASVRENLLYAREDATEEEMIAAARAAAIHERILELDEGYDTIVGERGYKLSGGEKQRIAITRVLLKNPRILILDEATSALDTNSERLIQSALEPLMKGRTTLAIAHRLSTILAADVILVVNHGQIVERGTHEELLALNGLYAQLYNGQFTKGITEEAMEALTEEDTSEEVLEGKFSHRGPLRRLRLLPNDSSFSFSPEDDPTNYL